MTTSLSIRDKILFGIDISTTTGIEIGPLMNPLVSKTEGDVRYVDRATTAEIKEWYSKNKTIDLDKVVEVDYVWGDKTLSQASGVKNSFDYCVAAHVIEHVPDLIGWLMEIEDILQDGGIASFSIPDRRYTFDYLRPETVTADLIDAYHRQLKKPSIRHIYDHFSNFVEIDIVDAWSEGFSGDNLFPKKDPAKVNEVCKDAQKNNKYVDSHCWVFTTDSFLELLDSLNRLGLLNFRIHRFFDVEYLNFEFVVQLEKLPSTISQEEKRDLFTQSLSRTRNHSLTVEFLSYPAGKAQVYFDIGNGFTEDDSSEQEFPFSLQYRKLNFPLPPLPLQQLRFDPVKQPALFCIRSMELSLFGAQPFAIELNQLSAGHHLKFGKLYRNLFLGMTYRKADDPFVVFTVPDEVQKRS